MTRHPPRSPLFPYTTLFRSRRRENEEIRPRRWSRPARSRRAERADGPGPDLGRRQGRRGRRAPAPPARRSEEHTSELQSLRHLVCRLLLEKKKKNQHVRQHI